MKESATVWDSGLAVKEERDCSGVAMKEERDCSGGRSEHERGARLFGIQEWP